LRVGAVEVEDEPVVVLRHRAVHLHDLGRASPTGDRAVEVTDVLELAVGQTAQQFPKPFLGALDRLLHDQPDRLAAVAIAQLVQPLARDLQPCEERCEVVRDRERHPGVGDDDVPELLVALAAANNPARRDAQALLVHVGGSRAPGTRIHSTKVDLVRHAADPGD